MHLSVMAFLGLLLLPLPSLAQTSLYVSAVSVADPARHAELSAEVESRILRAANTSRAMEGHRYDGVFSYAELRRQMTEQLPAIQELATYSRQDMQKELELARRRIAKMRFEALLSARVFPQSTGTLRVELELYTRSFDLLASKSVGGGEQSREQTLDALEEAVEALILGRDAPPTVTATVTPCRVEATSTTPCVTGVGDEVFLDAAASSDADHDTMVWTWTAVAGPEDGGHGTLRSGIASGRVPFRPLAPGEYRFQVVVSQRVGRAAEPREVRLIAARVPVADAGAGGLVQSRRPTGIRLQGNCGATAVECTCTWTQVEGPQVDVQTGAPPVRRGARPPSPLAEGTASACAPAYFTPRIPGVYSFELEAASGPLHAVARVSYLVAPKPHANPGLDRVVDALVPIELDATASFDTFDPSPTFLWEFGDCRMSETRPTGILRRPLTANPEFIAAASGEHTLRLTVRARRSFHGRDLWAYDCKPLRIVSAVREWTLFAFAGASMAPWEIQESYLFFSQAVVLGVNWVFVRKLGWPRGGLGIRGTQSLFRFRALAGTSSGGEGISEGPESGDSTLVPLGGSTVGLSYTLSRRGFDFVPHAGMALRMGDTQEFGLDLGAQVAAQVVGRIVGFMDLGYQLLCLDALCNDEGVAVDGRSKAALDRQVLHVGVGVGFLP